MSTTGGFSTSRAGGSADGEAASIEDGSEGAGLTSLVAGQTVSSVSSRREARRRLVLAVPTPPANGTELRLVVEPAALTDLFLNEPVGDWSHAFTWTTTDQVVTDTAPPRVTAVWLQDGHLEITFNEEPDPVSATSSIDLDGSTRTWELSTDGYTLRTASPLATGTPTLTVGTGVTDLAGNPLASPFTLVLTVDAPDARYYEEPDPRLVPTSTAGFGYGFHGFPVDAETGLLYVRHRYYDPELGRFIQPDPLGYVDGPSVYAYSSNDPMNRRDPFGLQDGPAVEARMHIAMGLLPEFDEYEREEIGREMKRTAREVAIGCPAAFPNMFAHIGGVAAGKHPMVHDFRAYGAIPPANREQLGGQLICGLSTGLAIGRIAPGRGAPPPGTGTPRVNLIGPRRFAPRTIGPARRPASPPPLDVDAILRLGRGPLRQEVAQQLLDDVVPRGTVGFASGEGVSALTANRLQHGTRHLSEAGVLQPWRGSTSPQLIRDALGPVLERPLATFDHVLRGGAPVKGFLGEVNGQRVVLFIYKQGPYQGQLATSVVPSASQLSSWGIP